MLNKAIAIAVLCCLCCSLTMAQTEYLRETGELNVTRQQGGLKGPVRTVETTLSNVQPDDTKTKYVESRKTPQTVVYDRTGNKTEDYEGSLRTGSLENKRIFVYDTQGQLQETIKYDSAGKIESKLTAKYDKQGRMVTMTGTEHSPANLLWGENTFELRNSFVYFGNGKTVEQIVETKDKDLPPFVRTLSEFGQEGHLLDLKLYMGGFLLTHRKYIYAQDSLVQMNEANYDVVSGKRAARAPDLEREFYSYDQQGNLIEIRRVGSGDRLESLSLLTYEFDAVGNWIKKSISGWVYSGKHFQQGVSKAVPRSVTRRIITYYE